MKQLSTVLNNISHTARATDIQVAEPKYSLTKEDSKTIIQEMAVFKDRIPQVQAREALALLTSLGNLSRKPRILTETVFSDHGAEFIPVGIDMPALNARQKAIAEEIVKTLCNRMDKQEFAMLYSKMKLITPRKETGIDENLAMHAYYESLNKYPASVLREAMTKLWQWFPSVYELNEYCSIESEYIRLVRKGVKGN